MESSSGAGLTMPKSRTASGHRQAAAFAAALGLLGLAVPGCASYSKEQLREMAAIRQQIEADPGAIDRALETGLTPLHMAVLNNYLPLMEWLLDRGAAPDGKDGRGQTPLLAAVISDRTKSRAVMQLLLRRGADVNAVDDYGDTPLHRAAYHGLDDAARVLLTAGADPSRRARRGETALHYAARPEGHLAMIAILLQAGADINAADSSGATPLHGAAMIGNAEVADLLLKGGAAIDARTDHGATPLHVAAIFGKSQVAALLLDAGAEINATDQSGRTPLLRARQEPAITVDASGKRPVDTSAVIAELIRRGGKE